MSAQEQNLLYLEIEGAIDKGRSPAEIRDLLFWMKQRDDLLASVGRKVDEALQKLQRVGPARPQPRPQPRPDPPRQPYTPRHLRQMRVRGARSRFNQIGVSV